MFEVLLPIAVGAVLTMIGCSVSLWKRRKISWFLSVLGALGAASITNYIVRADLASGKVQAPIDGAQNLIAFSTFIFGVLGLIAGACVVVYFRIRCKNVHAP